MKRVAVVVALVITVLALSMSHAMAQEKPNMFTTKAACEAALKSGNFRYYMPKFYGLNSREPVNGIDRLAVPLESDLCLEMQVVGGRRFVVQKEGTMFRAHKLPDGSLSLYARDDCGNRVFGVVFPAPDLPVAEVEPEPALAPVAPVYGPPPPARIERVVYRDYEKKSRKKWPWVLAGLAAGGGYATYYYWPCPPGTKRK